MLYFVAVTKTGKPEVRVVEENIACIDYDRAFDRFEEYIAMSVDPEEEFLLGMYDPPEQSDQGVFGSQVVFICSSRTGLISSVADLPVWLLPDNMVQQLLETGAFD